MISTIDLHARLNLAPAAATPHSIYIASGRNTAVQSNRFYPPCGRTADNTNRSVAIRVERYLYRGVNPCLHAKTGGKMEPKKSGQEFKRCVYYGEDVYYGDESVYGESETNAVIMHQRDSSKYPSAGVSTTPSFDNAKSYATYRCERGYVYKIDTTLLESARVKAYLVSDHAVKPTIPGDWEVILVAADYGTLPQEIVVDVIEVVKPCAVI